MERKVETINNTRGARVQFSIRLSNYSRKWMFILFFINVEAVIIVLLSLTHTIETIHIGPFNLSFNLFSGIFTLYVILLQYYINTLNYNERALQIHYHQLELEDIKNKLQILYIKKDRTGDNTNEEEIISNYDTLTDQYQLAMKNNENHRDLDYNRTKYISKLSNYRKDNSNEKPQGKFPKDYTLDIALIYANLALSIVMLFVISYVSIF